MYVPLISWYVPRRTTSIGDTIFASIVNIVTHRLGGGGGGGGGKQLFQVFSSQPVSSKSPMMASNHSILKPGSKTAASATSYADLSLAASASSSSTILVSISQPPPLIPVVQPGPSSFSISPGEAKPQEQEEEVVHEEHEEASQSKFSLAFWLVLCISAVIFSCS